MKSLLLILFVLTVLAQWAVPLTQIWRYEEVATKGELVRLRCRAPDPSDMFRGRYLAVNIEPSFVPAPKDVKISSGDRIYLMLDPGADGVAKVTDVRLTKPTSGTFIAAKARSVYTDVHIEWPIDRFYLNEKVAPEGDRWLAQNIRSEKPVLAEVRVLDGTPVLTGLTYDGKSFREILKAVPKE